MKPKNDKDFGVPAPDPVTESVFFNAAAKSVTVLVEGEVDLKFWRTYCAARVRSEGGRSNVVHALDEAKKEPNARLLGILDPDLDRLNGTLVVRTDIVWTDAHDLETTLLCLPCLEKILRQHVDPEKLAAREEIWGETFRSRLFRHSLAMGTLRWLACREPSLGLKFKKQKNQHAELTLFDGYEDCVGPDWEPSIEAIVNSILNYNNAQSLRPLSLGKECNALASPSVEQVSNGHDLIGFLKVGIEMINSKRRQKDLKTEAHWTTIVLASTEERWLVETAMWAQIGQWEAENPGFVVLIRSTSAQ